MAVLPQQGTTTIQRMDDFRKNVVNSALRNVLKQPHYPLKVMLTCVRWYVAYPLSLRHIVEMMRERGVCV